MRRLIRIARMATLQSWTRKRIIKSMLPEALVNIPALEQLESVLQSLYSMGKERALEVACGECHVT